MNTIHPSEITPEEVYLSRRRFMTGVGALMAGGALSACGRGGGPSGGAIGVARQGTGPDAAAGAAAPQATLDVEPGDVAALTDELGEKLTAFESVTNYNNFYEFSTDKEAVAPLSAGFSSSPWQVEVGGLVSKPGTYDLDALSAFDREERIYRLRCVEGWSMIIPWLGFPLARLLSDVEPTSEAKYVRFETLHAPDRMPGQKSGWYDWPYVEGLTLDEAMNNLAILATGLYGKDLLPQNGAPVRLVVPWKYGFKSIKSIVKIDLVAEQPVSLWMKAAPTEYGFYANVNPEVNHPRWSQSSERRIGEFSRRRTLMFNGYEEQVAHLYEGLDLRRNF